MNEKVELFKIKDTKETYQLNAMCGLAPGFLFH